jgi:hypothetical protein
MDCYKDMVASLRLALAHFSKEVLAGVVAFLKSSTSEIFKKVTKFHCFRFYLGQIN